MSDTQPLLSVKDLKKHYTIGGGGFGQRPKVLRAVDGISFDLAQGETLGIVGESGCGKSTAGKAILRLIEPTEGSIHLDGVDITGLSHSRLREERRNMQVVFQDPYSSLNPKAKAGAAVAEPLLNFEKLTGREREEKVAGLFERVGLRRAHMQKYPHEFSGGQRQRLGIARALALGPKLIVADEPVSALDVSVQAQVINLLVRLQDELGLSYIFIAHDLGVVRHVSHNVAVMYLGVIVEMASVEQLFREPLHPYSQALLASAPIADPRKPAQRTVLRGDIPSPVSPPSGCRFNTRCPRAFGRCSMEVPVLKDQGDGRLAACHLYD